MDMLHKDLHAFVSAAGAYLSGYLPGRNIFLTKFAERNNIVCSIQLFLNVSSLRENEMAMNML
jgi:hypothetical protein